MNNPINTGTDTALANGGVRASIRALLNEAPQDAYQEVLHQMARKYVPLTDVQGHELALKCRDKDLTDRIRKIAFDKLYGNSIPLALKAARDWAAAFGGDWRAALTAALEILNAVLPQGQWRERTVRGQKKLVFVTSGYNPEKAVLNHLGWVETQMTVEMVEKAQQHRGQSANTKTAEHMSWAKRVWADAVNKEGNWIIPVSSLDAVKVNVQKVSGPLNEAPVQPVVWDKCQPVKNFSLRPWRREELGGQHPVKVLIDAARRAVQEIRKSADPKKVEGLMREKGYSLERAIDSATTKATYSMRARISALEANPETAMLWIAGVNGGSLNVSLDAEDGATTFGDLLTVPEQFAPRFIAGYASEDVQHARQLLAQVGNVAKSARADLRDLKRTHRQVQRDQLAEADWKATCAAAGVNTRTGARIARTALRMAGARFAETLSDEQIGTIKSYSKLIAQYGYNGQNFDKLPVLKLALAYRTYGKRLGDAEARWDVMSQDLGMTRNQATHLALLVATPLPRARVATGSLLDGETRQAYAAYRADLNSEAAFVAECERQGLSMEAGKKMARTALSRIGARFAPSISKKIKAQVQAIRASIVTWALWNADTLGVTDELKTTLDLPALVQAFHSYAAASGAREDLTPQDVVEIEGVLMAEQHEASQERRIITAENGFKRALQHDMEARLAQLDDFAHEVKLATLAAADRAERPLDGQDWFVHMDAKRDEQALAFALNHGAEALTRALDRLETAARTGNVFLIALADDQVDTAVTFCRSLMSGEVLAVMTAQTRQYRETLRATAV